MKKISVAEIMFINLRKLYQRKYAGPLNKYANEENGDGFR